MNQAQFEMLVLELHQSKDALLAISKKLDVLIQAVQTPAQAAPANSFPEPWPGYDDLSVAEVLARCEIMTDAQREQVRRYEELHKNRKSVIQPLVNWNS